jgi:hypothetical protein
VTSKELARFEARYVPEPNSGCWLWTGCQHDKGYGCMRNHQGRTAYAHRLAYEHFVGPIATGMVVRHRCDTPCCVNPGHLLIGTPADNSRDMVERGRARRGGKLTRADVEFIRNSDERQRSLAKRFGVSQGAVSRVRTRESWRGIR